MKGRNKFTGKWFNFLRKWEEEGEEEEEEGKREKGRGQRSLVLWFWRRNDRIREKVKRKNEEVFISLALIQWKMDILSYV